MAADSSMGRERERGLGEVCLWLLWLIWLVDAVDAVDSVDSGVGILFRAVESGPTIGVKILVQLSET
jgi:hypothetical protein